MDPRLQSKVIFFSQGLDFRVPSYFTIIPSLAQIHKKLCSVPFLRNFLHPGFVETHPLFALVDIIFEVGMPTV